jgi:hypothetical protein
MRYITGLLAATARAAAALFAVGALPLTIIAHQPPNSVNAAG